MKLRPNVLKVGDKVAINNMRGEWVIKEVKGITPSGIVEIGNSLYMNFPLYKPFTVEIRGDYAWDEKGVYILTEETEQRLKEELIINKALKLLHGVTDINVEQAKKIVEVLEVED